MAFNLRKMRFDEVSFVTRPANPHARVVLVKSQPDSPGIMRDDDGKLIPSSSAKCKKCGSNHPAKECDKEEVLDKSARPASITKTKEREYQMPIDIDALPTEAQDYIAELEKGLSDAEAELEEAVAKSDKKKKDDESEDDEYDENDEVEKGLANLAKSDPQTYELVVKAQEEAKEAIAKAQAEANKATEIAKGERDARELREYISKASDDFSHLPTDSAEVGAILKSAHDLDPELATKLETVFKAASALCEDAKLFTERGIEGGAISKAEDKVTTLAKGLMEKDGNLTFEQAYDQALDSNPSLYTEIQEG